MAIFSYRTFDSANDEFALIFLADVDLSFLNRIHSIHVDATFKTIPVDLYQLLIIHCLVLDKIIPVFHVLMSGKTRILYDAVFLKIRSLAPQFNLEISVSDFEIALYSSIKFVFGSNLQGCLFHYRQSLYRNWQQHGFSCVKVKEVVSWVKQLMALPLLPTNLIHSVFYELSPSVLEINVLDAMATFYSYVEKQWFQAMDPKMLSVHGKFRRTNSEVESFHSSFGKRNGRKRPNFWFFLFKLKSVGKAYQLEANQLTEGILTRRYRRIMSKASDKFISEAEGKLATGRYTAQEFLQIVSHVFEKSFEKMANEEKNQENIENDVPLMTSDDPLECFEIECDEVETDCTKCCACQLEKINFCAKPCGQLMCTFCIEEDECLKCHTKIE